MKREGISKSILTKARRALTNTLHYGQIQYMRGHYNSTLKSLNICYEYQDLVFARKISLKSRAVLTNTKIEVE